MKIGINALSITPTSTGGGTTYIIELLNHLSQIDRTNKYILFVRSDSKHHFKGYGDNFRLFSIFMPPAFSVAFRIMFEQFIMPLIVWLLRLDILFCPGDSIPFHCPCLSVMVIQNLLYFHFQETSTLLHRKKRRFHIRVQIWYYNYITRRSAIKADKIITVSENAKKEIVEYFKVDDSKISVVYHGLGSQFKDYIEDRELTQKAVQSYGLKSDYLLYVGSVVPHKNVDVLVSTILILKERYGMKCQLVIAGSDHAGYSTRLKSIASNLGVLDQITFLGHIPYKELPLLYNGASIFIMPSLCESFGLPILEAMACGCPVVCSNASSLPEIAGDSTLLVDPKNPVEIANAIKSLFEDDKLRLRMINLGKNRSNEFSWDNAAVKTLSVFENIR